MNIKRHVKIKMELNTSEISKLKMNIETQNIETQGEYQSQDEY